MQELVSRDKENWLGKWTAKGGTSLPNRTKEGSVGWGCVWKGQVKRK